MADKEKKSKYLIPSDKTPHVKMPLVLSPMQGFVDFIRTQGVIGLAVGVVFGAQIKSLVDSFVVGFVNPLLGIILPGDGNLALKTFHVTYDGKTATFLWGAFLTQFISFLIVAVLIYFTVHGLKLDQLEKKKSD